MKPETKELFDKAVKVGESLARSEGRKADALERQATAAEVIAKKLTALIELAAAASVASAAPLTPGEIQQAADELAAAVVADKPAKKKTNTSKKEKGEKHAG